MKQDNMEEPVVEVVRLVPQARVQRVGEHIVDAPDAAGETDRLDALSEIEENGGAGEADRMDVLLGMRMVVILARLIGWTRYQRSWRQVARLIGWMRCWRALRWKRTSSLARQALGSAHHTPMEDVQVEASLLRFVDAVGGTLVVVQMQIPMVHTGIEALRASCDFPQVTGRRMSIWRGK